MKKIGIIGGGQLGMMLAEAAKELGASSICLDPNPNCPASVVLHKNIFFVAGDDNETTNARIMGFKQAMEESNLEIKDNTIVNISYGSIEEVEEVTEKIIKDHPEVTAIIYPDDMTAQAGIHKLRELNKNVPNDISVAGFDGATWTKYLTYPLTTMKQDTHLIAHKLAELLINVINNPNQEKQSIGVDAELVKGETILDIC